MGHQDVDLGNKVIALGFFNADAAPVWFGQKGFTATIVRNAAGDYTLELERALNVNDGAISVTGGETEAAQRSTRFGVTRPDATHVRVYTMQETGAGGGGASAAADKDFFIVVRRRRAG